jgi:hypothetical protein
MAKPRGRAGFRPHRAGETAHPHSLSRTLASLCQPGIQAAWTQEMTGSALRSANAARISSFDGMSDMECP